jgi:hypothetical protein
MSDISLFPRAYQTPEPYSRPTSSIVLAPTLEPIPGSAVVTPAARESPGPRSSHKTTSNLDEADLSHALERVETATDVEDRKDAGSYFAPVTNESASTSGLITPGGRQRPAIDIPVSTPDQPSFSSYPHQPLIDPSIASTSSKGKIFRNFSLRHPSIRSKSRLHRRQVGVPESEDEGGVTSDDGDVSPSGRRRSTSLSTAQSNPPNARRTPTNVVERVPWELVLLPSTMKAMTKHGNRWPKSNQRVFSPAQRLHLHISSPWTPYTPFIQQPAPSSQ